MVTPQCFVHGEWSFVHCSMLCPLTNWRHQKYIKQKEWWWWFQQVSIWRHNLRLCLYWMGINAACDTLHGKFHPLHLCERSTREELLRLVAKHYELLVFWLYHSVILFQWWLIHQRPEYSTKSMSMIFASNVSAYDVVGINTLQMNDETLNATIVLMSPS